jgi:TatD-related deoxyribonuclease
MNVEAVKEFRRHGGTHLLLIHLPYNDLTAARVGHFRDGYRRTLEMAERVRREVDVTVHVALGPYPVEILTLAREKGLEEAKAIMCLGMDDAARMVEERHAIAIGEIGRPHFPVPPEILEVSNEILGYGMARAKEVGCPTILHTESPTPETFAGLGVIADGAGLPREKVIKHFSPPFVRRDQNHGLFPSVIASEANLREAVRHGRRFVMETDYLDDPKRPGAVLGIATVPKKTRKLLAAGVLSVEDVEEIHGDNPRRLYGVE